MKNTTPKERQEETHTKENCNTKNEWQRKTKQNFDTCFTPTFFLSDETVISGDPIVRDVWKSI